MIYSIPLNIISIQEDGCHMSFQAKLGDENIHMLVDTGASRTVFDAGRITELLQLKAEDLTENPGPSGGIGTTALESSIAYIPLLVLGDLEFRSYPAALIDLSQVNMLFQSIGLPSVDGILGGDILEQTKAVIDYGKKLLKLKTPVKKKNKKAFQIPTLLPPFSMD